MESGQPVGIAGRAASGLALVLFTCLTSGAVRAEEAWVEVRSLRFHVLSDAGEKTARALAREFEQIRAVFESALPRARLETLQPTVILAARNEGTLKDLLPHYWEEKGAKRPAGVFVAGPFRHYIVLRSDARGPDRFSTVYHEYFHLVIDLNTTSVPLWFSEGLAGFWQTTRISRRRVEIGRPNELALSLLQQRGLLPLDTLFSADQLSPHYRRQDESERFYAQSWLLVHYLMVGGESGGRQRVNTYLALLDQGVPSAEAAVRAFGDPESVEKVLRRYLRRSRFRGFTIEAPEELADASLPARRLTSAETKAVLGSFFLLTPYRERARSLLEQALDAQPELALAHEGMGRLLLSEGERERAAGYFERALESDPASYLAHYQLAISRMPPKDPACAANVEAHLLRAIELNQGFAPGYMTLAKLYQWREASSERSLALARRAVALEPNAPSHRLDLAWLLALSGEADEARRTASVAVKRALAGGDPATSNNLCWYGSLMGFAAEMMPACEQAVRAAPDVPSFRDSRGLARALTGDYSGAAEDFRFYVEADEPDRSEKALLLRREWLKHLEQGQNPFDPKTLSELLGGGLF